MYINNLRFQEFISLGYEAEKRGLGRNGDEEFVRGVEMVGGSLIWCKWIDNEMYE